MAYDFLDDERGKGRDLFLERTAAHLTGGVFRHGQVFGPNLLGGRGKKVGQVVVLDGVFDVGKTEINDRFLYPHKAVVGGYNIELKAVGEVIVLFPLDKNIQPDVCAFHPIHHSQVR
jgi:hypothetical protein